ncbi:MAG: hypothetical protein WDN09_00715 [bacterium]
MNKEFLKRNKKVLLISLGVLVIVAVFFLKTSTSYKNSAVARVGLVYDNETLGDLVNRDTDGDTVMDWEEGLWGTDPKNPDTFGRGLGDAAEITKMKQAAGIPIDTTPGQQPEKLTETDKFSRELFTTVTALTQTGGLDQDTIDKLNASVIDQISNSDIKKTFSAADIKTTKDASAAAYKNYSDSLDTIFKRSPALFQKGYNGVAYQIGQGFISVMQVFQADENADVAVVSKLDTVISQAETIRDGMAKMNTPVPQALAALHLDVINGLQMVIENLNDLQAVESDPILSVGAANKFEPNLELLQASIGKLRAAVDATLKN